MNRRNILTVLPVAMIASAAFASASAPVTVPDVPFLHVLDGPIPEWNRKLTAGDMVLIMPGRPRWDTTCLMRDGRFAAVSVFTPTHVIEAKILGEDERLFFSREHADEMIAGRVAKWIRLDRGVWMD
jgi:hypothetical protein